MKSSKRDLLVLSRKASDEKEMEIEIEQLHNLLYTAESLENFSIANEIININKYKIIRNPVRIQRIISRNKMRPFEFINNKN